MEMNLILAKLCWKYDMTLVDEGLDWLGSSSIHVMWHKPELRVRFHARKRLDESVGTRILPS